MLGHVREVLRRFRLARSPWSPGLGGFVAVHAAAAESATTSSGGASAKPKIDRLVPLAPAFEFGTDRIRPLESLGWTNGVARTSACLHYAANEYRDVDFALHSGRRELRRVQPVIGAADARLSRPSRRCRGSCQRRALGERTTTVDLRLVDDGHQLTASMDLIWQESEKFLGLTASSVRRA
jgi:hypothetical protein